MELAGTGSWLWLGPLVVGLWALLALGAWRPRVFGWLAVLPTPRGMVVPRGESDAGSELAWQFSSTLYALDWEPRTRRGLLVVRHASPLRLLAGDEGESHWPFSYRQSSSILRLRGAATAGDVADDAGPYREAHTPGPLNVRAAFFPLGLLSMPFLICVFAFLGTTTPSPSYPALFVVFLVVVGLLNVVWERQRTKAALAWAEERLTERYAELQAAQGVPGATPR